MFVKRIFFFFFPSYLRTRVNPACCNLLTFGLRISFFFFLPFLFFPHLSLSPSLPLSLSLTEVASRFHHLERWEPAGYRANTADGLIFHRLTFSLFFLNAAALLQEATPRHAARAARL